MSRASWSFAAVCGIAVAALAVHLIVVVPRLGVTGFDDAYAFVRYARHWLGGDGFSWNLGEGPAYGCTSPLHLMLVTAALGITPLDDSIVLSGISFVCGLLGCAAMVALGVAALGPGAPLRREAPLLIVPCLLFAPGFRYHSLSGMETTLALLCNALLCGITVVAARSPTRASFALCLAAAWAAWLARPESGVFGLLFVPLYWVASNRARARRALLFAGLFVGLLAIDAALKTRLWGDPLPLSFYVKRGGFYDGYLGAEKWNAGAYMVQLLSAAIPYLLALVAFWTPAVGPRLLAVLLPVGLVMAYLVSVNQIMGMHARFYFPLLPFFVLAAFDAMAERARQAPGPASGADRYLLPRLAVATLLLVPVTSPDGRLFVERAWSRIAIRPPRAFAASTPYVTRAVEPLPGMPWWKGICEMNALMSELPVGVTIAASEHGYLGAMRPEVRIIDLVGLHDRAVAHHGFSAASVFERAPDLIWMPHPDYSRILAAMLDRPELARDFEFFPTAYGYGVALRRNSPHYATMRSALARAFARLYPGAALEDHVAVASGTR